MRVYIYIYIYIYISSSLVLCHTAGPWHPCPPPISILSPSFHFCIIAFLQIVNHTHPGLPLGFFPVILPSIISFYKLFPRTTCPIQFLFRFIIVCTKHLSSPTAASTSTFVFLSCQLTFSILLHTHISTPLILSTPPLFILPVS